MASMLPDYDTLIRLLIATLLGGLVGFERERRSWVAGLRTHMLVSLGACLIMIVSQFGFESSLHHENVHLDPSRIAAQVVSGIGFLGAGTILFWRNMIRGLTTAASLWAVAAVGLSVGCGLYLPAVCVTLIALLILAGLRPLEKKFLRKQATGCGVRFRIRPGALSLLSLEELLSKLHISLDVSKLKIEMSTHQDTFHLLFETISQEKLTLLMDEIKKLPEIQSMELLDETSRPS